MADSQVFTWIIQAATAAMLFLGKLALDDRDRRLTKLETFITERVRMNDEKLAGIIHRIAETERQNARAF